jgi:hypothetical protein
MVVQYTAGFGELMCFASPPPPGSSPQQCRGRMGSATFSTAEQRFTAVHSDVECAAAGEEILCTAYVGDTTTGLYVSATHCERTTK